MIQYFKVISPIGLLALAVCFALVLPLLVMDGMFMDGEMYTAVSHNLATGLGSWWMPYYTDHFHGLNTFHENPPGGTWLPTLFFKIFGSSMYVERFYIFCTMLCNLLLIKSVWQRFLPQAKKEWWLPFFFFILVPTVHWGFRHNMMENTMVLFVLGSLLALRKGVFQQKVMWMILAAILTWAAFMVKGPTGLFMFGAIPAMWLVWRPYSFVKMLGQTLFFVFLSAGLIAVFFVLPTTAESMDNYFFYRTLDRINNLPTVTSRFWIVGEWLMQILVPIVVATVVVLATRKQCKRPLNHERKVLYFFLILGAMGSLPLMLTSVQRTFYLITSFPFYCMALSILVLPNFTYVSQKLSQKGERIVSAFALLIFVCTLVASVVLAGKPKRDADILHDVYVIAELIDKNQIVAATPKANYQWSAKAYFMRKFQIQYADQKFIPDATYLLAFDYEEINTDNYCKVDVALKKFALYKKCH